MDWQFLIGLGITVIFTFLQFVVKNMPNWISWPCISIGILLIIWGVPIIHRNIQTGPFILFIVCFAVLVGRVAWYFDRKLNINQQQLEPTKPITQNIIIQPPGAGNLKQRANELSKEILIDLYEHGWPLMTAPSNRPRLQDGMPKDPNESPKWAERRTRAFMFCYFNKVIIIRDEFAMLHIREQRLDDTIKYLNMAVGTNKQLAKINIENTHKIIMTPQEIETVAELLKSMAAKL